MGSIFSEEESPALFPKLTGSGRKWGGCRVGVACCMLQSTEWGPWGCEVLGGLWAGAAPGGRWVLDWVQVLHESSPWVDAGPGKLLVHEGAATAVAKSGWRANVKFWVGGGPGSRWCQAPNGCGCCWCRSLGGCVTRVVSGPG